MLLLTVSVAAAPPWASVSLRDSTGPSRTLENGPTGPPPPPPWGPIRSPLSVTVRRTAPELRESAGRGGGRWPGHPAEGKSGKTVM